MTLPIGPLTGMGKLDAWACGYEFLPVMPPPAELMYYQHTMPPRLPAGHYSDDTQRGIAIANWLLHDPHRTSETFAADLLRTYAYDPRGYGYGMSVAYPKALGEGVPLGDVLTQKGATAGGAMGAAVLGVLPTVAEVRYVARAQALATHNDEAALAAEFVALMAFFLRQGVPPSQLRAALMAELPDERLRVEAVKKPGNEALPCALVALQVVEDSATMTDILYGVLRYGGDTDTVAAMASGVWASPHVAHNLPDRFWHELENGPLGRVYLRQLEMQLLQRFGNIPLRTA